MKKMFALVFSLALMLGLAFAQESGGSETGGAMMGGETGGAMMGESGGAMMGNNMMNLTFAEVDTNGDGSIDQTEFDAVQTKMMGGESGGAMMGESGGESGGAMMGETGGAMMGAMTFAEVDTNGDGSIDQTEFDAMQTKMMDNMGGESGGSESGGG